MPIREPQIVGNLNFKTKKDLHEYTEKLLEKKGICDIDNLDEETIDRAFQANGAVLSIRLGDIFGKKK